MATSCIAKGDPASVAGQGAAFSQVEHAGLEPQHLKGASSISLDFAGGVADDHGAADCGPAAIGKGETQEADANEHNPLLHIFPHLRDSTREDYYDMAKRHGDKELKAFLDANPEWQPSCRVESAGLEPQNLKGTTTISLDFAGGVADDLSAADCAIGHSETQEAGSNERMPLPGVFAHFRRSTREDYYEMAERHCHEELKAFLDANPSWQPS